MLAWVIIVGMDLESMSSDLPAEIEIHPDLNVAGLLVPNTLKNGMRNSHKHPTSDHHTTRSHGTNLLEATLLFMLFKPFSDIIDRNPIDRTLSRLADIVPLGCRKPHHIEVQGDKL